MVHFSCDLCGKEMCDGQDRFVVKIEVFAAGEPATLTEADLDEDNLEAVAQQLQDTEDDDTSPADDSSTSNFRFDLCPTCRKRYERAPLARDASAQKFDFSEN
jgi:hypothetical protein